MQFKFLRAHWELLKNKLPNSFQPFCWWQFDHNTQAQTLSHNTK